MAVIKRTVQADEDLIAIWMYIAQDNPTAADKLLNQIEKKFHLLASNPYLGPARKDIAEDCRYSPVGSYLILYRIILNGIEVVRVIQGSRRLDTLFP